MNAAPDASGRRFYRRTLRYCGQLCIHSAGGGFYFKAICRAGKRYLSCSGGNGKNPACEFFSLYTAGGHADAHVSCRSYILQGDAAGSYGKGGVPGRESPAAEIFPVVFMTESSPV